MTFATGQSGNPSGRPKGAKDKRAVYRALLDKHSDKLIKKAVAMAEGGDAAMLRLCIDRIVPPLKAVDASISIAALEGSISRQAESVLSLVTKGELTPDQGTALIGAIGGLSRIIEVNDLIQRIEALEKGKK